MSEEFEEKNQREDLSFQERFLKDKRRQLPVLTFSDESEFEDTDMDCMLFQNDFFRTVFSENNEAEKKSEIPEDVLEIPSVTEKDVVDTAKGIVSFFDEENTAVEKKDAEPKLVEEELIPFDENSKNIGKLISEEQISFEENHKIADEATVEDDKKENTAVVSEENEGDDFSKFSVKQQRTARVVYSLLSFVKIVCIGMVISLFLFIFVIQRNDVVGSSMESTFSDKDVLFVEPVTNFFKGYERGDVVTLDAAGLESYEKENRLIKRIIGLPGETLKIENGYVYINGQKIEEPYLDEGVLTLAPTATGNMEITLGDNEYFCMGDNRSGSLDSRYLGPFVKDRIKGHVLVRVFPTDRFQFFITNKK